MRSRSPQRGSTVVETVVATGLALVVLGAVFTVVAGLQQGASATVPRAAAATTAAGLDAELADTISDAAAKLRYYDHAATMVDVRTRIRATSSGHGARMDARPGAEPRETSFEGSSGGSASTLPSEIAHEVTVGPVFRVGDGLLWRTAAGELSIAGPVAVWREGALGVGEVGDSLTVLRTEAATPPLRLGAPFYTAGEAIRFVARDREAVDAIEGLSEGSMLAIVGRDAGGTVRSVLVEIRGVPRLVSIPSPANPDGAPVFVHYEAPCSVPGEPEGVTGLYNRPAVVAGLTLAADAAVARLDRTAPVVTYLVRSDERGALRLVRHDGRLEEGSAQELPGELSGAMAVEMALAPEAAGLTEADRQLSLTVSLALRTGSGGEHPVRAVLELREGAVRLSETTLYWDVVGGGGGT